MNLWHALLFVLVSGMIGVALFVWSFQRWGIYRFPQEYERPAQYGLSGVQPYTFISDDGAQVEAWITAPPRSDGPMIISFHGNAAGIGASMKRLMPLTDQGAGLAVMRYRGASGDRHRSSEAGFAMDARALYDQLDVLLGMDIPAQNRVLHGFSLGAAIGAKLAVERPFGAVILEASMPRACRYFARLYKGFPFCWLMWAERYDTIDIIEQITTPKLFLHGAKDRSVPVDWAGQLADVAPDPKHLVIFPEGTHADLAEHGLIDQMKTFIAGVIHPL